MNSLPERYTMQALKQTEKEQVREACTPIFDVLYDYVRESYADTRIFLSATDYFTQQQKMKILQAYLTNLHLAKLWKDFKPSHRWMVDNTGYFHLYDTYTGLNIRFHSVDPITRGLPNGNGSFSTRAFYTQETDGIADNIYNNVLEYPELSKINLIVACDYNRLSEEVFMRIYKPLSPGHYGRKVRSAYSFPVLHSKVTGNNMPRDFEPDPAPSENILGQLLIEETIVEPKGK